ncbi:PHP domain-containing protein [Jeotgalibaca sp. A122]|uniref:PHP domain-containing protein n=1 Tax=Jeotgalibaca sp. A122 TaxID=3457322 RepID=UPI003FD25386
MKYYDQHMHTYYSYDSEEHFENYLPLADDKFLVTTEHLDFHNPYTGYQDDSPDYEAYAAEIAKLNETYNGRILKGIEIGYTPGDRNEIRDYLKGKTYDVMLLSVHQNGKYDFMQKEILEQTLEETLEEYYSLMLAAVTDFKEANILTHFEYGLRLYDVTVADLEKVEPLLLQVFKKAVENNLAFELNSKSMFKYGNAHLYEYGIELYKEAGGTLFTVGSDAHVAADYEAHFVDMFAMLGRHGVEELVVFKNQQPTMVKRP